MDELPKNVEEGMAVFDRDNEHIGTVEKLRFGDEAAARDLARQDPGQEDVINKLAEAIWPDDMPEGERRILLSEGYLVLNADGLMAKDRFIRPFQMAKVDDSGVHLTVCRDDLAKT